MTTIAEELTAKAFKEGFAQGLEESRAEGFVVGMREGLEMALRGKFGTLSDAVTARIHAADRETIDRWLERALTADTAESVVES